MQSHYSQELEYILCGQLSELIEPNFIDVGAEKGSFSAYMLKCGYEKGYAFEPLPRHYEALCSLFHGSQVEVFKLAIDAIERDADFHVATNLVGEEVDYYHSLNRLIGDNNIFHSKKITVKCKTLNQLLYEGLIPGKVGLLKLDTEGNDLNVINGIGELRPDVIMCEFFMPGIYNGWLDARPSVLVDLLAELGYINYLAIKRNGLHQKLELNPLGYAPKCWGNLLFFSHSAFTDCKEWIQEKLIEAESAQIIKMEEMQGELEAKESVIQGLLSRLK